MMNSNFSVGPIGKATMEAKLSGWVCVYKALSEKYITWLWEMKALRKGLVIKLFDNDNVGELL